MSLFQRWMDAGYPRLEPGRGRYEAQLADDALTLTATGEFPSSGYRAWFDRQPSPEGTREYIFYFEPPVGAAQPATVPFKVSEEDLVSGPISCVVVIDAQGRHEIPVRSETAV